MVLKVGLMEIKRRKQVKGPVLLDIRLPLLEKMMKKKEVDLVKLTDRLKIFWMTWQRRWKPQ